MSRPKGMVTVTQIRPVIIFQERPSSDDSFVGSMSWDMGGREKTEGNNWDKAEDDSLNASSSGNFVQGWLALSGNEDHPGKLKLNQTIVVNPEVYIDLNNPTFFYNNSVTQGPSTCRRYWLERQDGFKTDVGILCWEKTFSLESDWGNDPMNVMVTYGQSASINVRGSRIYWLSKSERNTAACDMLSKQLVLIEKRHFKDLTGATPWINSGYKHGIRGVESWDWSGSHSTCSDSARKFFAEVLASCEGANNLRVKDKTVVQLCNTSLEEGSLGRINTRVKDLTGQLNSNANQIVFCTEPVTRVFFSQGDEMLTEDQAPLDDDAYVGFCPNGVDVEAIQPGIPDRCLNGASAINCKEVINW